MTVNQTFHFNTKTLAKSIGWEVTLTGYKTYRFRMFIAIKLIKLAGVLLHLGKIEIKSEILPNMDRK